MNVTFLSPFFLLSGEEDGESSSLLCFVLLLSVFCKWAKHVSAIHASYFERAYRVMQCTISELRIIHPSGVDAFVRLQLVLNGWWPKYSPFSDAFCDRQNWMNRCSHCCHRNCLSSSSSVCPCPGNENKLRKRRRIIACNFISFRNSFMRRPKYGKVKISVLPFDHFSSSVTLRVKHGNCGYCCHASCAFLTSSTSENVQHFVNVLV